MDTRLAPDALLIFATAFYRDERIAVVGANISPDRCIPIEKYYWRDQNILRIIESGVYAASIVIAPCYAFRNGFIDRFPADCIADDIHIAFRANTEGYLTKYEESICGLELRSPQTFSEFFQHKYRKGNAYLIELFRFLYRLPHMSAWWKLIYLTKILQLVVIPWLLPYFLLSTVSLSLSGRGLFQLSLFGLLFLGVAFLITSALMKKERIRWSENGNSEGRYSIFPFLANNIIMVIVGLSFPFFRQTASYPKLLSAAECEPTLHLMVEKPLNEFAEKSGKKMHPSEPENADNVELPGANLPRGF
jgi:cellulose synthase/poly-beta-1,6-N-acetylglucosamine synthase-like glycosyltransferase